MSDVENESQKSATNQPSAGPAFDGWQLLKDFGRLIQGKTAGCTDIPVVDENFRIREIESCDPKLTKLSEQSRESVFKVFGGGKAGSGFYVGDGSQAITNRHVLTGGTLDVNHPSVIGREVTLLKADGTRVKATVQREDKIHDLVLLQLAGEAPKGSPIELGNSEGLQANQPLYALGNPLGMDSPRISIGQFKDRMTIGSTVASYNRDARLSLVHQSAPENFQAQCDGFLQVEMDSIHATSTTHKGNSGGALVDENGKLVGVVQGADIRQKNHTRAIPVEWVKHLMDGEPQVDRSICQPPTDL